MAPYMLNMYTYVLDAGWVGSHGTVNRNGNFNNINRARAYGHIHPSTIPNLHLHQQLTDEENRTCMRTNGKQAHNSTSITVPLNRPDWDQLTARAEA